MGAAMLLCCVVEVILAKCFFVRNYQKCQKALLTWQWRSPHANSIHVILTWILRDGYWAIPIAGTWAFTSSLSHLATEGIQYIPSKDMGSIHTCNARAIDCVVRYLKVGNRWGIVDWRCGLYN